MPDALNTRRNPGLDSLDEALARQARALRAAAPAGISPEGQDRTIAALRSVERDRSLAWRDGAAGSSVKRRLALAACVVLAGAAAMLARIDGRAREATPSASAVLSNSLRGIPRQPQDVVRLASMPIRKEAQRLAQGSRKVLSGLELLTRPSVER
jgi:hypothetical protein